MNLQHLEYFFAIAENKSISKAAEALYISQPSLSRVLRSIEAEMGAELFRRTARGVELTEAGEELYLDAKCAVEILNNAKNKINEKTKKKEVITLYTGFGYMPVDAVEEFHRLHPSALIEYQFVKYDYDNFVFPQSQDAKNAFCVMPEPKTLPPSDEYGMVRFGRMEPALVVPEGHRLSGRSQVELSELKDETFIVPQEGSPYRYYADELFAQAGFEPIIEDRAICEEPVYRLRKAALEIMQVFSKAGYKPSTDPNMLSIEYRDKVMLDRGDVVLVYARGQHSSKPGTRTIRISAPEGERWSYLIWSKKSEWSPIMEEFSKTVSRF